MKFILLSILLAIAVATASARLTGSKARFATWAARFGKKNDDKTTEEARLSVFEKNCELIDEQNEKFLNGSTTFYVDLNEHSALLPNEKKNLKGFLKSEAYARNKRSIDYTRGMIYRTGGTVFYTYRANASAPKNNAKDWRTVWKKPIDNQGSCGSCWSFSATAVVDAAYAIKRKMNVSTSKQELLDCSSYLGNKGCDGGVQGFAFEYAQTKGIGAEAVYPKYRLAVGACTKTASPNYKIDGFVQVEQNEEALRQAIDELGACTVSIDTDSDPLFMSYKGGIYNGNGRCSSRKEDGDHAVVVVGYGVENNVPFWIIRNSWGTTWGEAGYMRLRRNFNNLCGVVNYATCVVLK